MTRPVSSDRRPLSADLPARPGLRRLLALPILGLLAAAVLMLAPALASADSASTLSIVGTSDMTDSGLMPNLIQPQFQAAFPGSRSSTPARPPGRRFRTPRAGTADRAS